METLLEKSVKFTAVILSSLLAFSAQADNSSFQHEISIATQRSLLDTKEVFFVANYHYYSNPVTTHTSPFALNTALSQSTNIGIDYSNLNANNTDDYSLDGTYVFDSHVFISAEYKRINGDSDEWIYSNDERETSFGVQIGYYLSNSAEISFFYREGSLSANYRDNEVLLNGFDDSLVTSQFDAETVTYGIYFQNYIPLQSFGGINLQFNWHNIQKNDNELSKYGASEPDKTGFFDRTNELNIEEKTNYFTVSADYYFNQSWSVGANYQWWQRDTTTTDYNHYENNRFEDDLDIRDYSGHFGVFGINTAYWWQISSNFSAEFSVSKLFNTDSYIIGGSLIGINAKARF
ncbi:hypothetical protein [Shewanella donghaensis]|uniref:hypothetical protein n=1 Tax=Shewanella donghaensis TaxID=238836 RepID=UPI00118368FF|nr:hypothetical protein [Shewanella donghaensis]